jgi:hypothetical protein
VPAGRPFIPACAGMTIHGVVPEVRSTHIRIQDATASKRAWILASRQDDDTGCRNDGVTDRLDAQRTRGGRPPGFHVVIGQPRGNAIQNPGRVFTRPPSAGMTKGESRGLCRPSGTDSLPARE